jgi:hypothetical protein
MDAELRQCYTKPMSVLSADTHPKMKALQIQLLRQASPTRKMEMLVQLNASAAFPIEWGVSNAQ